MSCHSSLSQQLCVVFSGLENTYSIYWAKVSYSVWYLWRLAPTPFKTIVYFQRYTTFLMNRTNRCSSSAQGGLKYTGLTRKSRL